MLTCDKPMPGNVARKRVGPALITLSLRLRLPHARLPTGVRSVWPDFDCSIIFFGPHTPSLIVILSLLSTFLRIYPFCRAGYCMPIPYREVHWTWSHPWEWRSSITIHIPTSRVLGVVEHGHYKTRIQQAPLPTVKLVEQVHI